jgi:hypothetical protein
MGDATAVGGDRGGGGLEAELMPVAASSASKSRSSALSASTFARDTSVWWVRRCNGGWVEAEVVLVDRGPLAATAAVGEGQGGSVTVL